MTAGQVWQRRDGLRWVEVQTAAVEPSRWRLMVPLDEKPDAPEAPPLVVTVGRWRARVHLITSAPADRLGHVADELGTDDLAVLREAVRALVRET